MTPRLPTELLAHILVLACADQPALARRQIRHSFRLVCRDWYSSFDQWKSVATDEVHELSRASAALERGSKKTKLGEVAPGLRVKRAYVGLTKRVSLTKLAVEVRQRQQRELSRFLKLVERVEEVELEIGPWVLSIEGRGENLQGVAPRTWLRLSRLSLVANCPTLTAFALKRADLRRDSLPVVTDLLDDHPAITSLALTDVHWGTSDATRLFVPSLPDRVTALAFSDELLYAASRQTQANLINCLQANKDTLKELVLLDVSGLGHALPARQYGQFGAVLEQLVNLRKLEISPAATDNLVATLAPLTKLETLAVIQGRARSSVPLSATAICDVLEGPASLRRVALSSELVEAWSGPDRQRVADVAAGKGIAFVEL